MLKRHVLGLRRYSLPPGFTLNSTGGKLPKLNIRDIADTLKNDPNLEAFYDEQTLQQVQKINANEDGESLVTKQILDDAFNLSLIDGYEKFEDDGDKGTGHSKVPMMTSPQTLKTSDFIKLLNKDGEFEPQESYSLETTEKVEDTVGDKYVDFKAFFTKFETLDRIPLNESLESMVKTELPLIVISKLTTPIRNLAIEKYVYDKYPDVKNPLNRFSKRLVLYKNSPCIVVGKNQNIFKEINFRLASLLKIDILRRYSGGGTVVHDLGNYNFSFMCPKEEFDRVGFTNHLINTWNKSPTTLNKLNINEKGDMIDFQTSKKVSGSAFQISKGKSLHHGTMLLNSNLETLGKLLKLSPERLAQITDKATNSIPSPIMNTQVNELDFVSLLADAFTSNYGLPTALKSRFDNLYIFKSGTLQAQVLVIDDLTPLPEEVAKVENELQDWSWVFGKSPRFEQQMSLDSDNLKLKFVVAKGRIASFEFERVDGLTESRFDDLVLALKNNVPVYYNCNSLTKYILDFKLAMEIGWNIDQLYQFQ